MGLKVAQAGLRNVVKWFRGGGGGLKGWRRLEEVGGDWKGLEEIGGGWKGLEGI